MSKIRLILSFFLFTIMIGNLQAQMQTMTDTQVMEYVKQGMESGKDQQLIAKELIARGVTREQAERVKKLYEEKMGKAGNTTNKVNGKIQDSRMRTNPYSNIQGNSKSDLSKEYEEEKEDEDVFITIGKQIINDSIAKNKVFGRSIFNTRELSFEPSMNLATPPSYRLGPGDEVIIDIWGTSQNSIRQQISPEGTILVEKIGPVNLNGMTVASANEYLRRVLSKTYAGLSAEDASSQIMLTLGNARTIQVNVMGEVKFPGTYALSSFSTVFHALYRAGGVSEIGSLRYVQLVRGGKQIASVDVYEFIMKGKVHDDIHLQEGDVVIVPAYESLVKVRGNVKREMLFEMKKDESLSNLIRYFGGFTSKAYTRSVRVVSQNGAEFEVNTVADTDFNVYRMRNGDEVTVDSLLRRFTNKLELRGAVYRPGIYQLNGRVNTVRSLIKEGNGLLGEAFTNRAVLQREREDLTTEIISVNVRGIVDGIIPDVPLRKNDILFIPSIYDIQELGEVQLMGEVMKEGKYPYSENMTLEDLIIRSGGLKDAASLARVDVSRRIKDPKSVEYSDSIGQLFSFALKDGFVVEGTPGFVLMPYDQVIVRRSPGYQVQQNVKIMGEVLFSGTYAMTQRDERLSDLLRKAGGATPKAYLKGAKLTRKANDSEMKRMEEGIKMMNAQFGEKMVDSLGIKVDTVFTVGINLQAAAANPGGPEDLVLREGDILNVPILDNTVKINGAVMMPNTVAYKKGENVKYYLNQAGGYGLNAKKSKKFIIYMNGTIARVGSNDKNKVEPGCEIFVPSKGKKRTSVGEILGYASSIGSLATMFATIGNLIK